MPSYSKTCSDHHSRVAAQLATWKAICGAIIFVDLDRYLSYVENLRSNDEWAFAESLYKIVETASAGFGITLVRTFGDGFLFYVENNIDKRLLEICVSFLASLRNRLSARKGMSFKASVVAGSFLRAERIAVDGSREIILAGAAVNLAGKQIALAEHRSLFVSWPLEGYEYRPLTFAEISRPNPSRRIIGVDISQAESVALTWPNPPCIQERSAPPPDTGNGADILKFVNDTKTLMFESIKLADDKAKAVFAVSSALLVYLFNGIGWPKLNLIVTHGLWQYVVIITLAATVITLVLSAVFSLCVVMPRMQTSYDRGLVFFGSIVNWSSGEEYADNIAAGSIADLRRESARHNYELARVAVSKFGALNRCLIAMGIGVVLALIYIGLTWDFPPPKSVASSSAGVSSNAATGAR